MDFIAWHNDKSRLCHYERECLAMVHGLESHEYRFDMIWYSAEWDTDTWLAAIPRGDYEAKLHQQRVYERLTKTLR